MIKPYLKTKLSGPLCGTHISMTDSIVSEVLGMIGFDFVWIDTEYFENSYTSLRNHTHYCRQRGRQRRYCAHLHARFQSPQTCA